jgi:hypothetical protein
MSIEDFVSQYREDSRNIHSIIKEWQISEMDTLLQTACNHSEATLGMNETIDSGIGGAVVIADAILGGTLLDQIPQDVQEAFANLMGDKADTYSKMRQLLLSHLKNDQGTFRAFDDCHVVGFVNKLKGQIGENIFKSQIGLAATLAESGSQEGWDLAVNKGQGLHEYVQVKLYHSPRGVVQHMLAVHEKLLEGSIKGVGHETVQKIYFAVPEDIRDDVLRLAKQHDGLAEMLYDKSIPITSRDAAGLVTEGMSNVGPDQLGNFFNELICGAAAAGSLHAAVNGFLWYKGSKDFSEAFADTAANTAVSTVGIGLGLLAESLFSAAIMSSAVGIGARMYLGRVTRSRWDFADFLHKSTAETTAQIALLR